MSDWRTSNYERLGQNFSQRSWARSPQFSRHLADLFAQLRGNRWLEVGCGVGDFTRVIHRNEVIIVGVDASRNMLRASLQLQAPFLPVQAYAEDLPFLHHSFGSIVCRNLLKHCTNEDAAIAEMYRVCQPDGRVLIVESCARHDADRDFMNSVIAATEPEQKRFKTPEEWVRQLTMHQGSVLEMRTFTHRVISTTTYRKQQYGLDDFALSEHWRLFSEAPAEIRIEKEISQSVDGELRFLLSWVAILLRPS